ncbi:hypothetical protein LOK46_13715 [Methylobacterium sp. NMS14P]|uniref:hypothetical protein n=1 Tax=Methylobacterium sp. NMS14P TaxID=2894310 RepID=UPI002358B2E8|nr:hypothetical protein [Methylobacterium sp. NMS14P]WCS27833.1 hypothetical protein LOK46_13715 [Methylobacterium sp. NMS14P]
MSEGPRPRAGRLGQKQLESLLSVASPTMLMLTPGKVERGLVAAGLLVERPKFGPALPGKPLCGAVGISAAGLRRLADEIDAGRVQNALEHWARIAAERRTSAPVSEEGVAV